MSSLSLLPSWLPVTHALSPSAAPSSPSFTTVNVNSSSTAAAGYGPLDCSERVNSDGVLKGMAAIWAAHQVNIRRGKGERLRIGVSVYDSCSSSQVIQRQSLRLLATSLFSPSPSSSSSSSSSTPGASPPLLLLPSLKSCREAAAFKTQPLIFGTRATHTTRLDRPIVPGWQTDRVEWQEGVRGEDEGGKEQSASLTTVIHPFFIFSVTVSLIPLTG